MGTLLNQARAVRLAPVVDHIPSIDPYGPVYFVSVDYNSITGLTTEFFPQKNSICAAVAAATGALQMARLGTVARGPPPPRQRLQKLKILKISFFWLRTFLCEVYRKRAKAAELDRKSVKIFNF